MRSLSLLLILIMITACDQEEVVTPTQVIQLKHVVAKPVVNIVKLKAKQSVKPVIKSKKSPDKKKVYQKMKVSRFGWAYSSKKLYQKVVKSLVTVQFYVEFGAFSRLPEGYKSFFNEEENTFSIPGVLVGEDQVLTVYSILRDASVIFLKDQNGTSYLNTKGIDEEFNLVLLEAERPLKGFKVLKMPKRDRHFLQGQQLYTLGSPHLLHQSFWRSELNLLYYSPFHEAVTTLFSEAATPIARAGSAVFNRRGGFCGIVSLYDPYFEHSGMVVTVNLLKKLLPKLQRGYNISNQGWIGLYLRQDGEQVFIKKILPEGPASVAGLHPGDQIISVNQIPIKSKRDIKGMMKFMRPKNRVQFQVIRNEKAITIELKAVVKPLKYQINNQPEQQEYHPHRLGLQWNHSPEGVQLLEIEVGSLGFIYGFKKGDCLLALNQTPVNGVEEYKRLLKAIPSGSLLQFKLSRRESIRFIAVKKP